MDILNNILNFINIGLLFVGLFVFGGGVGFVGCITSGKNILLVKRSEFFFNINGNCTFDYVLGCGIKG